MVWQLQAWLLLDGEEDESGGTELHDKMWNDLSTALRLAMSDTAATVA
jgi:hypothetical protein